MSVCGLLASLRGWGAEHHTAPVSPSFLRGWNLGKAARQPAEKLDFLVSPWMVQFVRFQQELRGPPPPSPWQPGRLYSSSSHSPPKTDALSRHRKTERPGGWRHHRTTLRPRTPAFRLRLRGETKQTNARRLSVSLAGVPWCSSTFFPAAGATCLVSWWPNVCF